MDRFCKIVFYYIRVGKKQSQKEVKPIDTLRDKSMEQSNWQRIQVGKLYIEGRTKYNESIHFNYMENKFQLLLCFKSPNKYEISSIKKGLATFKILTYREMIFFLFKFKPDISWSDAPYHVSAVPPQFRTKPDKIKDSKQGILLTIILIDADTGIVEAIRAIGLNHKLSNHLIDAIRKQYDHPLSMLEYNLRIDEAYKKFVSTRDMVKASQF